MQSPYARWISRAAAILVAILLFAPLLARAQLSIEITGAGANRIPIAIVPFPGEAALPPGITSIVRADLERSGLFRGLEVPPLIPQPTEASTVDYAEWRSRLADALVLGSVAARPDGRYEVRFRLFDVVKQTPLGGVAYTLAKDQARATAHRIADYVYEKLTGVKGVFSTRIAYVVKRGNRYELQIADADGADEETALASLEPIISPAWAPDGKRLAYVSFENKKPVVYVHSLLDGKRHVVANFKGSNSAPAWSPDGTKLAVSLSRDNGSQIYLINPDGSGVRRPAYGSPVETQAVLSPERQVICFPSDRRGSPPAPPRAARQDVRVERHGRALTDSYDWLRDPDWQRVMREPSALQPEIRAHLEAENAYAAAVLAPVWPDARGEPPAAL